MSIFNSKTLIVIAGATAVGKTDLCIRLAKHLDTEIVSADSRQFYREISIGTAKPSTEEMQGVKHHFINSHSINTFYSVGDFERDALLVLEEIFSRKSVAILTGGSGLYIKAVLEGFDEMPEIDPELRQKLNQQAENEGIAPILQQLQVLDPEFCQTADLQNTQRLVRALEVCLLAGKPFSSFKKQEKQVRPFNVIKIVIDRPREDLYARIDARMDMMLANGLLEEAKSLYPYREHNALKTVGYREVFAFLEGQYDQQEMIRLLKQNSRRYAKRQLTWFRHQDDYTWFQANDETGIKDFIDDRLRTTDDRFLS